MIVNTGEYQLFVGYESSMEPMPVLPEIIEIVNKSGNTVISLISIGEANVLKSPKLTEFKIDFYLPHNVNSSYVKTMSNFKQPKYYIDLFQNFQKNKKSLQFQLLRFFNSEFFFDTNIKVSVEDYTLKEIGGDVGSFILSVKFKEYRDYSILTNIVKPIINQDQTLAKNSNGNATVVLEANRTGRVSIPTTYTVVSNDSLWDVAKRFLNDGSRYIDIAKLNGIKNPNKLVVGTVLNMPAL